MGMVEAQLGYNLRAYKRKVSLGIVGTQLGHISGTHFSLALWDRVIKVKVSLKIRN